MSYWCLIYKAAVVSTRFSGIKFKMKIYEIILWNRDGNMYRARYSSEMTCIIEREMPNQPIKSNCPICHSSSKSNPRKSS
jgi:hypothetical protein